ncbi:MAG: hypothetical protein U5R46_00105 [Gammaproteobacteria bacterium]|nr:hypothetical protein [Gammaproteobacteria bacterium]
MSGAFHSSKLTVPTILIVGAALLIALQTRAEDTDTSAAAGPLDGMVFEGLIGPTENPDLNDRLYFQDGKFWSSECIRCGFEPGAYWVRRVNGGIAFRGTLQSPDRGRFRYEGFVRDGEIEVSIDWRQERWYWTVDRQLRFEGQLVAGERPAMTLGNARALALRGNSGSGRCPS